MSETFKYDVFLSHSSKDKEVVREVAKRLKDDGLKVWFDEWVLKPGDNIPSKIEEGLEHSRVLVLCMSANAFGSDWAELETGTFRFRDPLNKERRFIPLRLDDAPIKGSLAQFLYINWLPADREQEYAKLVEACRPPAKHTMAKEQSKSRLEESASDSCRHAYSSPSVHFITPPDPDFVGRDDYLKAISAWHEAGDVRVGSLVGFGGSGKSSIARKWYDQQRNCSADAPKIFWWGFDKNPLLDECLNCLLEYLSDGSTLGTQFARPMDKVAAIKTSLLRQKCLVFFDGFEACATSTGIGERAPHDYIGELLKSFAESTGTAFLLITIRWRIDELRGYEGASCRVLDVEGFSFKDAKALFKHCKIRAEDRELETIWETFAGHALSLRLLTTLLKEYYNNNIHAVQEIPNLTSDGIGEYEPDEIDGGKARKILLWYDHKLTETQRTFLKIFSLFAKSVTQHDFLSVFRKKDDRLQNDDLVGLSDIAFTNLVKKLTNLRLIQTRDEKGQAIYEGHPLIREYFSALVGKKETPMWHEALTEYYSSIVCVGDDEILRDRQIIHHALRAKMYSAAFQATTRLLPYLRNALTPNGTIGLIRPYHVAASPLAGTSYGEVLKKALREYDRLRGVTTQTIYIRSAYFDNEEIDFDYFWERASKKAFVDRVKRMRLLPCAIELIRNSRNEPFSNQNPNRPFEIVHRFIGITKTKALFFVHIMEDTKTDKKFFMSAFPQHVSAKKDKSSEPPQLSPSPNERINEL